MLSEEKGRFAVYADMRICGLRSPCTFGLYRVEKYVVSAGRTGARAAEAGSEVDGDSRSRSSDTDGGIFLPCRGGNEGLLNVRDLTVIVQSPADDLTVTASDSTGVPKTSRD